MAALDARELRRDGYVHLYTVAEFAVLLARLRGVDAELAAIAGMLHDIYTYKTTDTYEHAYHGATLAREMLTQSGLFTEAEIDAVCTAIRNHSKKHATNDTLSEVLKDADVLSHNMYNPLRPTAANEQERMNALLRELSGSEQ